MRTIFRAIVAATLLLNVTASIATAHFGASAQIIVTGDSIVPGQEFEVVAIDLTPGAIVEFDIRREDAGLQVPLESATSSADGHFRVNMSIPAEFPTGYAQLFAVAQDGTQASTWVLVGERTAETPAAPPGVEAGPWYADPSVIVLAVIAVGALGAVGYLLVKRRLEPARAAVSPSTARPSRLARKRHR